MSDSPSSADALRILLWAIRDSRHPGIGAPEKAALFALASRLPDIRPGFETLAEDAGISRSTACVVLSRLERLGLVNRGRVPGVRSNIYTINVEGLRALRTVRELDGSRPVRAPEPSGSWTDNRPGAGRTTVRELDPKDQEKGSSEGINYHAVEAPEETPGRDHDPRTERSPGSVIASPPPPAIAIPEPLKLEPSSPARDTKPQKPAPRRAAKPAKKPRADSDEADLKPSERAALEAIRRDPDLFATVERPAELSRDLVKRGPLVDIPVEIHRAGQWLRDNQEHRPNGRRYLQGWIDRAQKRTRIRGADEAPRRSPSPHPGIRERARPEDNPEVLAAFTAKMDAAEDARPEGTAVQRDTALVH